MPTTLILGPYRFRSFQATALNHVIPMYGATVVKQNSGLIQWCWPIITVFGVKRFVKSNV